LFLASRQHIIMTGSAAPERGTLAYQFVHLETYSRKGRSGRGVDFILAEAERRLDACLHVAAPTPPETVFGVGVAEVRRLHDERAATATATTKAGKTRRIRSDQNTLLTVVASHPATMEAMRADPATARAVREWEVQTVTWLRGLYGDQLASVVRHVDEAHPHLHAFVLPNGPEMRAGRLHPGQEAKARIVSAGPTEGEDGKILNRRGDTAYRASMRAWQDSYWQAVGLPCGLTRLGPSRRRLTREEWQAEKVQAQALRLARERVDALHAAGNAFVTKTRTEAIDAVRQAQGEAAEIRAAAIARQEAAMRLSDHAEARIRKAHSVLSRARREGTRILEDARAKARRLRSIGSRIRSLWDGLRWSTVEARIRDAVTGEIAAERDRAEAARLRAADEARRRRDAERARDAAVAAIHAIGRERDAARRRLVALLPDAGSRIHHGPRRGP
jgi:predicted  nucleic acid-binding Zn-ribbon protein